MNELKKIKYFSLLIILERKSLIAKIKIFIFVFILKKIKIFFGSYRHSHRNLKNVDLIYEKIHGSRNVCEKNIFLVY
jgi:hypothetical protein